MLYETKKAYNFFYFKYLTIYLSLKLRTNGNIERREALLWTLGASTFSLRSYRDIKGVQIHETISKRKNGLMDFNEILASAIRPVYRGKIISAIIVTGNYL